MSDDEKIILVENDYYRVFCLLTEQDDGKWLARVRVVRKDTEESVKGGFTVFESNKENALESVNSQVKVKLFPKLEKSGPPSDWDSEVRRTLLLCKKLRSNVFQFGNDIKGFVASCDEEDKFWEKYAVFWKQHAKEAIALSDSIGSLSAEERVELLTSPDSVFTDPSDSRSLEDIDLRIMVFDFFVKPSELEVTIFEKQKNKLEKRFAELGWQPGRSG
ncbi:MAG: hypothetical protein GY820_32205 [Gammaproteobacteria bacterium]|nr:hypothetical protein [Gammaproteobacteria bacterium]